MCRLSTPIHSALSAQRIVYFVPSLITLSCHSLLTTSPLHHRMSPTKYPLHHSLTMSPSHPVYCHMSLTPVRNCHTCDMAMNNCHILHQSSHSTSPVIKYVNVNIISLFHVSIILTVLLFTVALASVSRPWPQNVGHGLTTFCSLVVLDPRVGHTMDVHSPFISVLCHSD